ncbi:MAG: phosphopantetheine-binding protein [Caldilineaceae bacterium]
MGQKVPMMTTNDYRRDIKEFLVLHVQHPDLQDDEDIFAGGFVTSLFAMQLVLFIETQLGVQLANQDLKLDNFRTIQQMVDLLERKLAA